MPGRHRSASSYGPDDGKEHGTGARFYRERDAGRRGSNAGGRQASLGGE